MKTNIPELLSAPISWDYRLEPPENPKGDRIVDEVSDMTDEQVMLRLQRDFPETFDGIVGKARDALMDCLVWEED